MPVRLVQHAGGILVDVTFHRAAIVHNEVQPPQLELSRGLLLTLGS